MTPEHAPKSVPAQAAPAGVLVAGALRVGPLVVIPQLLADKGLDPAQVIAEAGIRPSLLEDPENTISFATMGQLLWHCAQRTGCPHFGLLVGEKGGAESLGVVGLLALQASDVGGALRDITLHLHLHDRGAISTLWVGDDVAVFGYAIYQRGVVGTDHIYDGAIAIAFNIMRELCGPAWLPKEVLFCHSKALDIQPFRRFFKCPLRFDAERAAVVFPASWLQHPLSGNNLRLRHLLEAEVVRLESQLGVDLPDQLRCVLRNLLVSGGGSLEEVAQLLGLHRRTLNRRLRAKGMTFKQLVEEARFEISHQLLRDTRMPLTEIAELIAYADAASFGRAFRRWSGTTPGAWREAIRDNARSKGEGAGE